MLSQQTGGGYLRGEPFDANALVAGLLAGNQADIAAGHTKRFGQERDQGVIGRALHGRSGQADEDRVSARPVNAGAGRPRNHADVDNGGGHNGKRQTGNGKPQTANGKPQTS